MGCGPSLSSADHQQHQHQHHPVDDESQIKRLDSTKEKGNQETPEPATETKEQQTQQHQHHQHVEQPAVATKQAEVYGPVGVIVSPVVVVVVGTTTEDITVPQTLQQTTVATPSSSSSSSSPGVVSTTTATGTVDTPLLITNGAGVAQSLVSTFVQSSPIAKATLKPPPISNLPVHFFSQRADLRAYGVDNLIQDQVTAGWFSPADEKGPLRVSDAAKPFNPFARLVSGELVPPYGSLLTQVGLAGLEAQFMVAKNRPELDEQWASPEVQWVGKASMSQRHQFLLVRSLEWSKFNVLTFGMETEASSRWNAQERTAAALYEPTPTRVVCLRQAIQLLNDMESAALAYTKAAGWSEQVGLFFHSYLLNSVHALHLHMIDLSVVGPTYAYFHNKNLPLSACRIVLEEELRELETKAIGAVQAPATDARNGVVGADG